MCNRGLKHTNRSVVAMRKCVVATRKLRWAMGHMPRDGIRNEQTPKKSNVAFIEDKMRKN